MGILDEVIKKAQDMTIEEYNQLYKETMQEINEENIMTNEKVTRTIAIVLYNNDFGNTLRPVLESIYNAITWSGIILKENIERCIREGLKYHYMAFQLGDNFGKAGYGDVDSTGAYLTKLKVLFDEEAEKHIQEHSLDGGAGGYLELNSGKVYLY